MIVGLACVLTIGRARAQTRAGTAIPNVATVQATASGAIVSASSNTVTLLVAERLDVALVAGQRSTATAFAATLTNRGNGQEAFALVATAPDGVAIQGIAIDVDGDGAYDPARDQLLTGGTTPSLDPGGSVPLLLLIQAGAGQTGTVSLVARSVTGSGPPGTTFTGKGDGGSDAVVGATGAIAQVDFPLAAAAAAAPTLFKSQSVRAPDGSTQPVAGAVVTYTLQATFADRRLQAHIDDPIPAGSRYVPGSLTLDGVALTDVADGDPGAVGDAGVGVSLGDVAGPAGSATSITHTVQFQVVLQ